MCLKTSKLRQQVRIITSSTVRSVQFLPPYTRSRPLQTLLFKQGWAEFLRFTGEPSLKTTQGSAHDKG